MTLAIVLGAVWLLTVVTVASLCEAARTGDRQVRAVLHERVALEVIEANVLGAAASERDASLRAT
jgi:hypothetical protein